MIIINNLKAILPSEIHIVIMVILIKKIYRILTCFLKLSSELADFMKVESLFHGVVTVMVRCPAKYAIRYLGQQRRNEDSI